MSFETWPELAEIAKRESGVREVARNDSPRIRLYWQAVASYDDGWKNREPWCAAFVSWCIWKTDEVWDIPRPSFPSVRQWLEWCIKNAEKVDDAQAGDIVIFLPHFSHIGIVTGPELGAMIPTIEGNTNDEGSREGDGVYRRKRPWGIVGSIWRLP